MKLHYYTDTRLPYISLSGDKPSVESEEVSPGVVLDFDDEGHVVGIDIDPASQLLDLSKVETEALPAGRA